MLKRTLRNLSPSRKFHAIEGDACVLASIHQLQCLELNFSPYDNFKGNAMDIFPPLLAFLTCLEEDNFRMICPVVTVEFSQFRDLKRGRSGH